MARQNKKRKPWVKWALLALVLFSLYHFLPGQNGLFKLMELRREERETQVRIDSLTVQKQVLIAEKERLLTDSAYLEKLARQELGMARPKEKVYRFVAPAGSGESTAASQH